MLKKKSKLLLGFVVVLAGSACVTPTHVSSALGADGEVIITRIQAGAVSGAKEEFVVLHNNSAHDINITDWCLLNKSSIKFACFSQTLLDDGFVADHILSPHSDAVIVSQDYSSKRARDPNFYSLIYESASSSSGSIVGSSDSISVVNDSDEIIATKSWSGALAAGRALARLKLVTGLPDIYATANDANDWYIEDSLDELLPFSGVWYMGVSPEGGDSGDEEDSGDESEPVDTNATRLVISELLANPAGVDSGFEYIELHNPSSTDPISLSGYKFRVGTDKPKDYILPDVVTIEPLGYYAIYNNDMTFALVNTTGRVQLLYNDSPVGDPVEYSSPKDNQSWALIDGLWQYSSIPTPGLPNELQDTPLELKDPEPERLQTEPKPCAANQYRNPETGRCRLISAASSSPPAPCKPGQERNPETNRCRNIESSAKTLVECKQGQERNPETNRCRNVSKMTSADHGVLGVNDSGDNQPSWYYWGAIGMITLLVIGYAIWEWRHELRIAWERITAILKT